MALTVPLIASIKPKSLPAGIVAWWKGDNNALDEGGAYNGTWSGTPAYATDRSSVANSAFSHSGSNTISIPSINIGSSYSIEFWFYPTSLAVSQQDIVGNDWNTSNATKFGTIYVDNSKSLNYFQNGTSRVAGPGTGVIIATNNWYKCLFTYDGGTSKSKLYINDLLIATESGTHTETFNNAFKLAASIANTTNNFSGRVDEVILYSTVKTGLAANSLVAWYKGDNNVLDSGDYFWHASAGVGTAYANDSGGNANSAFSFNGNTNSAVTLPAVIPLTNSGQTSYTIEFKMFLNAGNTGYRDMIANAYNIGSSFGDLYFNGGNSKLEYWEGSSSRVVSASTFSTSVWYTIKLQYNGATSKSRILVGGVTDATESGTHTETFYATPMLGYARSAGTAAFNGRLDDVKFYNGIV